MDLNAIYGNTKVNLQYFMPKHLITVLAGLFAAAKLGKFTAFCIKNYAKLYDINLDETDGQIGDFATFNDFFARPLKKGTRPLDAAANSAVFPSDGRTAAFGKLEKNFMLQAKGHYYTAESLLADHEDAKYFADGSFMTVYLAPGDYHRVHMPLDGKLLKMTHVPGELFSVNPLYVQNIPELYTRNERVVCLFETEIGKVAVVFVGAEIVRSIATAWAGTVAPSKSGVPVTTVYEDGDFAYAKGEEIGRFFMGSTVICLFEKDKIVFDENLQSGQPVKARSRMGSLAVAAKNLASGGKTSEKTPRKRHTLSETKTDTAADK